MIASLRLAAACKAGELAGRISVKLDRGRGETLSGRVILAIDSKAIAKLSSGRDIVLVSGTNGKTTSTKNLAEILREFAGEGVSTSESGANMPAGIASLLAQKPRNRFAVIECDEMYLPEMYQQLAPKVIVLLNLSRDQLHRTGEVRKVSNLWHQAFTKDDVTFVIDRDDPFLEHAVSQAGHVIRVSFSGRRHPDSATCPNCSAILDWSTDDYSCHCGLGSRLPDVRSDKRLNGPQRNTVLVVEAARLMGAEILVDDAAELIRKSPDRIHEFSVAETKVSTHLAKNPESWRQALGDVTADQIVLSVNARGIDGRDTSWLWDIDYSQLLGKRVVCTGERRLDVAYRLSVQGIDVSVASSFAQAVQEFFVAPIQAIVSYTAYQDLLALELGINSGIGDSQ
ncbi:MAG: MurT ligase domain-containing protein [Candidatus Nanopelagicales bacterium]